MKDAVAPVTWVSLGAGDSRLAIPAASVRKVMEARRLTPVPLTRPDVIGVMVESGRAVPVYRLVDLMSTLAPGEPAGTARGTGMGQGRSGQVAILEHEGCVAGFLVDATETITGDPPAGLRRADARDLLVAVGAFERRAEIEGAAEAAEGE